MGANPHANGGLLAARSCGCPISRNMGWMFQSRDPYKAEDTRVLGAFLRDVIRENEGQRNFRIWGPDETLSNRLNAVFEATNATMGSRKRSRAMSSSRRKVE